MTRLLTVFFISLFLGVTAVAEDASKGLPTVTVYKSATCGCCGKWVEHMQAAGFKVKVESQDDMAKIKKKFNITDEIKSCHTAKVGDYIIEGHVPPETVKRLLKEHPAGVAGIAVPGMPVGSPGMEDGDQKDKYDVVSFDQKRQTKVYESH